MSLEIPPEKRDSAFSTQRSDLSPQSSVLSIIIPNWNGAKFLPTCLDALSRQTHSNLEIIVVDNASGDGSQDLIKTRYPQVILLELPENRGFTGACNAGMQAAKGDLIAL